MLGGGGGNGGVKEYNIGNESKKWPILYFSGPVRLPIFCAFAIRKITSNSTVTF